jgi:hypothetical protein
MKGLILTFIATLLFKVLDFLQNRVTPAPLGYDIMRSAISRGNADTILFI